MLYISQKSDVRNPKGQMTAQGRRMACIYGGHILHPQIWLLGALSISLHKHGHVMNSVMFDIVWTNRINRMTYLRVLEHLLYSYDYSSKLLLVMDNYVSPALALLRFQV
jgi:hypothetical protein